MAERWKISPELPEHDSKTYEDILSAHVARIRKNGNRFTEEYNRDAIRFDFSKCQHESVLFLDVGGWTLIACERCAAITGRACRHEKMEWMLDGQVLVCTNCGTDGT
jgi:hypothetical protein